MAIKLFGFKDFKEVEVYGNEVGEKICGKCCFWFTGYCYKRKKNIDILSLACEDFKSFNKYIYQNMKGEKRIIKKKEDFIE